MMITKPQYQGCNYGVQGIQIYQAHHVYFARTPVHVRNHQAASFVLVVARAVIKELPSLYKYGGVGSGACTIHVPVHAY